MFFDVNNVLRGTIWGLFVKAAIMAAHYCTYIC